jgi:ferredoxin-like protein FixX
MGRFIEIAVRRQDLEPALASAVVGACPADIFIGAGEGSLATDPTREDECILCGRCVALAGDAVTVTRLYGPRRRVSAAGVVT